DPLGRSCLRDLVAAQRLADLQRSSSSLSWPGFRLRTANRVNRGSAAGRAPDRRDQDLRALFRYHGDPWLVGSGERGAARISILVDAAGKSGPRHGQALALFLRLPPDAANVRSWPELT